MIFNFMENYRKHNTSTDGSHDNTFEFDCMFSEAVLATDIGYANAVITEVTMCAQEAVTTLYAEADFIGGIKNILSKIWEFIKKVLSGIKNIISKVIAFITKNKAEDKVDTGTVEGKTKSLTQLKDELVNKLGKNKGKETGKDKNKDKETGAEETGNKNTGSDGSEASKVNATKISKNVDAAMSSSRAKFLRLIFGDREIVPKLKDLNNKIDSLKKIVDELSAGASGVLNGVSTSDRGRGDADTQKVLSEFIAVLKSVGNVLNFILLVSVGMMKAKNIVFSVFDRITIFSKFIFGVVAAYSDDVPRDVANKLLAVAGAQKMMVREDISNELINIITNMIKNKSESISNIKEIAIEMAEKASTGGDIGLIGNVMSDMTSGSNIK